MRIQDTFSVDAPVDEVYATLLDLGEVAGCVPGATLIGQESDDVYTASIRVKVGPITMNYRGQVEIVERDAQAHRAVLRVKARELRGQGMAEATAEVGLEEPAPSRTTGKVDVDLSISGRVASMGQGAIQDVSTKIVGKFADNLATMLEARRSAGGNQAEAPEPAATVTPPAADEPDRRAVSEPVSAAAAPPADDDALSVGELAGAVIAGRLREPKALIGVALLVLLLGFVLGRRSAR